MPISNPERRALLSCIKQKKLKVKHHQGWKNFAKNISVPDATVLDIEDKASLQTVIKQIHKINQTKKPKERIIIRVANSESYSFTSCAAADVVIRLTGKEFHEIKSVTDNVIHVGASAQIGTLDKELYEEHKLVLPTSSLIPYVTVAGLAANAGHGTGQDQPSFAGLIRAITLCLPNGEIVHIDSSHEYFETICGAHLGLFGIVLDVELECAPAKKMQCVMEVRSVPELIQEIKGGLLVNDPYVSIMYVPTYQADELTNPTSKNVIVYRWRPVELENDDVNTHFLEDKILQALGVSAENVLGVADLLRHYPFIIPYFTRYLVAKFAIGEKDSISVGPWYGMHYQTAYPWDIDDADYLFQVSEDCNEIISALEKVVTTLTDARNDNKFPITNAIYLRYFQGTNGGLSTSRHEEGKHVCGFDMVSSSGIAGYAEFKEEMKNYFIYELGAVPHWGKYVPDDVDYAKLYKEDFEKFIAVVKKWYEENGMPLEKSMLLNHFLCEVLQLPYMPVPRKSMVAETPALRSVSDVKKIASELLACIDEDDEDGKLRKCLQEISAAPHLSSGHGLFRPCQKNDPEAEKKSTKCCVLM